MELTLSVVQCGGSTGACSLPLILRNPYKVEDTVCVCVGGGGLQCNNLQANVLCECICKEKAAFSSRPLC